MGMMFEDQCLQAKQPKHDCVLFDLDDTLYPLASGIAVHCRKNIEDYMVEMLGFEPSKVSEMAGLLYRIYGTTMAGLRAIGYTFNYDHYHSFVHGRLPYDTLKPDPVLRQLILSIPVRKVIFTNADKVHAAKVLSRLGLEGCFEGIICFETLNRTDENSSSDQLTSPIKANIFEDLLRPPPNFEQPKTPVLCKPSETAMIRALEIAKLDPQRTIFFDDSIRNIQAGKRIGLNTVLVGASLRVNGADHVLESVHNIKEALPELWEEADESRGGQHGSEVVIEMPVSA
ncbi:uncharacterized protein C24B11.05-like [Phalaenopsis equestris]|uniref:uncharacterized protein C24B11.05-like n=1 Tax=Phalaenopsis equestris TaxID=78828 RepID=UPI0009E3D421|nr:uncharacterized protein C24B11.05-like [Phalaenopsis equestris]